MCISYPDYYHRFHCIAGACPDSCCKEWAVDVDPEAAARYAALPGPLGDRLRQVLCSTEDGFQMTIEDSRCPMWQADGLCRIQAQLGHDALCKTCREFPRIRHEYDGFTELGLELSCPEAARLILSCDYSAFQTEGDMPAGSDEIMEILLSTRQELLTLLDRNELTPPQFLSVLLLRSCEVQQALDGGDLLPLDPEKLLTSEKTAREKFSWKTVALSPFFQELEILTHRWQNLLQAPTPLSHWPREIPALTRYLIQRYWLQAVSDYDILCRGKFIVTACLLMQELGGDIFSTAQLFSKEIENDPDNLEAIFCATYDHPAFADLNLLHRLGDTSQSPQK